MIVKMMVTTTKWRMVSSYRFEVENDEDDSDDDETEDDMEEDVV